MNTEKQVKPCPKCKKVLGWREKRVIRGDQYFDADGTPSHFVDSTGRGGVRKYCYECDRDITKCIGEAVE